MRAKFAISTVCYLFQEDKVLMIKFSKKWGCKYAPIGGKMQEGETPTECVIREFKEETNLDLINPQLKGIAYWQEKEEGIIFVYTATQIKGSLRESDEGTLEWIKLEELGNISQFAMNQKFSQYLIEDGLFEGRFSLDENTNVKTYTIRKI